MPPKLGGGGEKCVLCKATAFPAEQMRTATNQIYHSSCFRCTRCRRPLTPSTYAEDAATKRLYCLPHYKQLASQAGLAAVASGGIDASAGVLVSAQRKVELQEEAELLSVGSNVWLDVEALDAAQRGALTEPFASAVVKEALDEASQSFKVQLDKGGKQLRAAAAAVSLADRGTDVVDNLQLLHLTEANLLHNLRSRFEKKQIYTWTGSHELLAINPYEHIKTVYELGGRAEPFGVDRPHAYAVAERVHAGAVGGTAQAVVVSGESGAHAPVPPLAERRNRSRRDERRRRVGRGGR
jgi:hypothetical protein